MATSRAGDASEGKHAGSLAGRAASLQEDVSDLLGRLLLLQVSSFVIVKKTSGQIFKLLTTTDSLLVTGSNDTFFNVLSSIYCHLWS